MYPGLWRSWALRSFLASSALWTASAKTGKLSPPLFTKFVDVQLHRIVGFEDLGNDDAFSTVTLELRLSQSGRQETLSAELVLMGMIGVLAKPTNDVIPTMYGTSSSSTFRVGGSAVRARSGGDDSDLDI